MAQTYCGNNASNPKIVNGTHVVGSLYKCLKKGVGVGKYVLPFDPSYLLPYNPIDNRKYYCGTKQGVPNGYFARGSPSLCFRKGVGVGKKLNARQVFNNLMNEIGRASCRERV